MTRAWNLLGVLLFTAVMPHPVGAQDFDAARIESETIGPGLHVLYAVGGDVVAGNIAVSTGPQGVLIVDDQMPELTPKYRAAIDRLGAGDIDFVVNTHWHFDHANGNKVLAPEGAWIVAHQNSREMLLHDNHINLVNLQLDQPSHPPAVLPVLTYDRLMSFHFNGERIDLMHFGAAHTTGDTAVVFRGSNAVHMGDIFNTSGYPFIDADNGGSLAGVLSFCRAVLKEIDEKTIVIPGHGRVSDYKGLVDYVEMLSTIHDRIRALVDEGASLEKVLAAKPTAEWDARLGDPVRLVDRTYAGMTR